MWPSPRMVSANSGSLSISLWTWRHCFSLLSYRLNGICSSFIRMFCIGKWRHITSRSTSRTRYQYRHKILIHYVPMTAILFLSFIYSSGFILFYPCEEAFDYTAQICGGACYQYDPTMGTVDVVVTVFLPLFLITLFNTVLILRVLNQKRRMQQKNIWKKNLHLLIQLLSITLLHYIVWLPTCIIILISIVQVPPPVIVQEVQASWVLFDLLYVAVLGSPFTCAYALPEIREKISAFIHGVRLRAAVNTVTAIPLSTRMTGPQQT